MRILVISDVHANLTALNAVLADAGLVDAVWCLGDLVGYGPDPNECVEAISSLPNLTCLIGNHDAAALGQIDLGAFNRDASLSAMWMQNTLTAANLTFLKNLPDRMQVNDVTLVHGSPRNPVWEYLLDLRTAANNFDYFNTQVCLVGHTHLPVIFMLKEPITKSIDWRILNTGDGISITQRAIINPGSVGQPRDHDPRAAYAIYDPDALYWKPYRVQYDVSSVQKRIYDAGLPRRHALRLEEGW